MNNYFVECERRLTESEEGFKMQIQDKIDGMKKLLDRESQRCQDMVKTGGNENGDVNVPETGETGDMEGLKSIIERQNQIIEQYRLKVIKLESGTPKENEI